MGRRALDKYYTPAIFIPALYENITIKENCTIFEPCVGAGVIVNALKKCGVKARWVTNDIDPNVQAVLHRDASKFHVWAAMDLSKNIGRPDWVITNPPFNRAVEILDFAREYARIGVAFYLRLSFQEACQNREELLWDNPPNKQITLPRFSFSQDGKNDSVTGAWFTWEKGNKVQFMRSYNKKRLLEAWEKYNLGPLPE